MARLAGALRARNMSNLSGSDALTMIADACAEIAAEDAEREGHSSGTDTGAMSGGGADRPQSDGGSTPPGANRLPPLDPALVEECLQLFYKHGGGVSSHAGGVSMDAALTHYRERVEGPLREELEKLHGFVQHSQDIAWHHGEKRMEAMAEADRLRGELARERKLLDEMEKRKDGAYEERNRVVALLAALYPSKRCRTAIEGWSDDWHGCVYIETPEGQLSWHYHDSQASMFAHVPEGAASWDGHTTEEKYRRVGRLCVNAAPVERAAAPQPTDEERQRLADMARYYGGQGASSLVYVRADDMRRIATLLEQPAPAPPRKSIGRRWVVKFSDGELHERVFLFNDEAYRAARRIEGSVVVPCDLVPMEEDKP